MMQITKNKVNEYVIKNDEELDAAERKFRDTKNGMEFVPFAQGESYRSVADDILKDKRGPWAGPLILSISRYGVTYTAGDLCQLASGYLNTMKKTSDLDILSISASIETVGVVMRVLVRPYFRGYTFRGFFLRIGDNPIDEKFGKKEKANTGRLVVPDEVKNFHITEEEKKRHDMAYAAQEKVLESSTKDAPFLNSIKSYVPRKIATPEDSVEFIYDLKTKEEQMKTIASYKAFRAVFEDLINYINEIERFTLVNVMNGEDTEDNFMNFIKSYIEREYVKSQRLPEEDVEAMLGMTYTALFRMYVLQDLIDDPMVTDIKVTAPSDIRARVKGRAYSSNISFINRLDYERFVSNLASKNKIALDVPEQTFTDNTDPNYILRFSITAPYVNSVSWPYLHIRKVSRKKLLAPDLIRLGMFDEKIRDYLIDCGKYSKGVVFAGPPGSGKTVCLNWFLEDAYEPSAEILVIQENDELFAEHRKGVMFEHVVSYSHEHEMVTLEQLGQLALVQGANVFVIGEAKGPEICSAITLSNSGCRTAITIHSPSSTETLDKMADLAMRGYAQSKEDAMRMLKSFQTIVYLEDFQVKEISEITGFDEDTKKITYRYIYRKPEEEEDLKYVITNTPPDKPVETETPSEDGELDDFI